MVTKPEDVFDRDWEWSQLSAFASGDRPGAALGVVSGRRRQGKTYLLEALCETMGGFFHAATEALPRTEALRQLGESVTRFRGHHGVAVYRDWDQAIADLLSLADERAIPVVIDEFPYLVRDAPELPSVVQKALSPRGAIRLRSKARLLLCGSAVSFMAKLLTGAAPLRGRAALELIVHTFDYRLARRFWGIDDHRLAAQVYFVVGGTPAYRGEYLPDIDVTDFDEFVVGHVLNPASPLFREVRALLAEEPSIRDTGMYHTVLAAIAEGDHTRSGIASRLERKATDISHHLTVLEDSGFVCLEEDAFRAKRRQYRITEPLVSFYHAITRPNWTQLERARPGRAEQVWHDSQRQFLSNVAGPAFQRMCQVWTTDFADIGTIGVRAASVRSGIVYDKSTRRQHELDLVVADSHGHLGAIGEVKWGDIIGMGHLRRLEEVAAVLKAQGKAPDHLLLFSGTGFMPALQETADGSNGRIQLIDLRRLYEGS